MQPPFVHGFLTEWGFLSLSSNCTGVMTGWSDAGDDRHHVSMSVMALFCQETLLPTSPPQASALHLVCPVLCGVPRPLGKGGVWAILTHGREHLKLEWLKESKVNARVRIQRRIWYQSLRPFCRHWLRWERSRESLHTQWLTPAPFVSDLLINRHKDAMGCSDFGLRNPQVSFGPSLARSL